MAEPTIFVVTDADDLTDLLRMLRREGYQVIGTGDCESAQYMLQELRPDLLITDYPELLLGRDQGLVRCLVDRGIHARSTTLALLREEDAAVIEGARGEGFHEVYVRPVKGATLLPVVRRLLGADG
ncbi:MAG TPA: hypothetical protein VF039_07285 [Longimicrobiales bacterium]